MPMLKPCAQRGCVTLTLGGYCVEHERANAKKQQETEAKPPRLHSASVLTAIVTVQLTWLLALAAGAYRLLA